LKKIVLVLKLFEWEIPVLKTTQQLQLSYKKATFARAGHSIRQKIYEWTTKDDILKGEVEADESYFGGKRKGQRRRVSQNKVPVFGILEKNGKG